MYTYRVGVNLDTLVDERSKTENITHYNSTANINCTLVEGHPNETRHNKSLNRRRQPYLPQCDRHLCSWSHHILGFHTRHIWSHSNGMQQHLDDHSSCCSNKFPHLPHQHSYTPGLNRPVGTLPLSFWHWCPII